MLLEKHHRENFLLPVLLAVLLHAGNNLLCANAAAVVKVTSPALVPLPQSLFALSAREHGICHWQENTGSYLHPGQNRRRRHNTNQRLRAGLEGSVWKNQLLKSWQVAPRAV